MATTKEGYRFNFFGKGHNLKLPVLNSDQVSDAAVFQGNRFVLDYPHYSIVMSKNRRFAYYTAVNIDGTKWQDNYRQGRWKKDPRITEQYGIELYSAKKSDFDKGHLVRREEPEWGSKTGSTAGGRSTFVYTNCVPQHRKLNREIWDELESNILHKGAVGQKMKISVFTGPVLSASDPAFVTRVNDREVMIPTHFWKIVTWVKSDGKSYAVGFIQSQEKFLIEDGIASFPAERSAPEFTATSDDDYFENIRFRDGNTYQVRIEEIEHLTGLKFDWPEVIRPFKGTEPKLIVGKEPQGQFRFGRAGNQPGVINPKLDLEGLEL